MKIVVTGANGYIGQLLVSYYAQKNAEVIAITRHPHSFGPGILNVLWDGKTVDQQWALHLNQADAIINLAGKSVDCRYNEENKQAILDSRIQATEAIAKAIAIAPIRPKVWINAASATIYRHADDRPMDEHSGEIGTGFSVEVCKKWEKIFFEASIPATRRVALRIAIVLGKESVVWHKLQQLVRFGLGGPQGSGKQKFSWIHDSDLCKIIDFIIREEHAIGVYNASAPQSTTNGQLMSLMRQKMGVTLGLPTPQWLLELGAKLIGTETELILKSRWVVPTRLLEDGFDFQYSHLEEALENLL